MRQLPSVWRLMGLTNLLIVNVTCTRGVTETVKEVASPAKRRY